MLLKKSLQILFKLLFRVEIKGNIQQIKQEKMILAPNHTSLLDGFLLGLFLPIEPVFAIFSAYLDKAPLKWIKNHLHFLPVDPNNPFAIKTMIREVSQGSPLVIFPEGRITVTGNLMKTYDGAGFIAAKTEAKIIPIRIEGAEFSYFGYLKGLVKLRFFPKITIHILDSVDLRMPTEGLSHEKRQKLGEQLHQIMMNSKVAVRPKHTLWQAFITASQHYGKTHKIIEDINFVTLNYRDLIKRAYALSLIIQKNTEKNEPVGLLLPNTIAMGCAILAVNLSSKVSALLNYTAGVNGVQAAIKASQIKTVLTSRTFIEKANLNNLINEIPHIKWVYLEDFQKNFLLKEKLDIVLKTYLPSLIKQSMASDNPAVILFTSGSEGTPKGVVHTNESILANVEQIKAVADFTVNDKFMSCLPLFHAFGLTAGLFTPLLSGSQLFLYPSPLHYRVIPELIYDKRCTVLFGTSTFLQKYAKFAHPYDFVTLRYVVAGAERLAEKTKQVWQDKFGIRILEGYGVTECAPVISINLPMAYKSNSIGQLLPLIEYRLVRLPGLTEGKVLQIKGPNLMKGYLRVDNPGVIEPPLAIDAQGVEHAGWYDTGDIVSIDDKGFLSIKGRAKRFAKVAGEMVSLEAIELALQQVDPSRIYAVVAVKDDKKGEQIVLFTNHSNLQRTWVREQMKSVGLPEIASPKVIQYIETLPLLGTGKVDFVTLNKMAQSA